MLPGSFTSLLLEISDFSNFTAKNFAESPHFGVGQSAAGHFVVLFAGRRLGGPRGGGRSGGYGGRRGGAGLRLRLRHRPRHPRALRREAAAVPVPPPKR